MSEPSPVPPGDCATVSILVAASCADAFDVFTHETDLWWKRGPAYRIAGKRRGTLCFEPGAGGRLFETFEGPSGTQTFDVGRITSWDPPSRLAFEWRGVNYKPDEKTFVEVAFEPSRSGTLVTVRHRGWSALPSGHPVRHGLVGPEFSRMIGLWWGELMTSFREHVAERGTALPS